MRDWRGRTHLELRDGQQIPYETLSSIGGTLLQLMNLLQGADVTPTTQLTAAVAERRTALNKLLSQWTALKAEARTLNLTQ